VGEKPVCVETCMTDAIYFGELEQLKQRLAEQDMLIVEELSKESVLYVA